MKDRLPHQGVWSIVPPDMLRAIAENGTPEEREYALVTLAQDTVIRAHRVAHQITQQISGRGPDAGAGAPHRNRLCYTASNGSSLPGTLKRSEGQAATGDAAINQCYDGLGGTFDLYWDVFGRNSIDGNGLDLKGTVHYGSKYNNAFWNGTQMVFGDGDGVIFNSFTADQDIMGHELTHGVTGATAALEYHDQPGALNESISDCFGSMVKQRMLGQTSAQADWLIGAHLLAAGINGVALRSMKAPGTAYNDAKLGGKDPQPDHMSRYVNTSSDNGGVHTNSGIPNKAFYLVAIGLGGNSWDRAGHIWYKTLTGSGLSPTASFADFAKLTADNANSLYGASVRDVVIQAWHAVGIDLATVAGWYYNKSVLSTFTSPHSMNAWANVQDLGWRKVQPLTPDGVSNMFVGLTEAQASTRKVHVYADVSLIYQAYSA